MPDGYSLAEAAELLGVSERRVWQLFDGGLLMGRLGSGGSLRVYLSGEQKPLPVWTDAEPIAFDNDAAGSADDTEPAEPSASGKPGNGSNAPPAAAGSDHFREILGELRHLQERYGQALLALGEARGEVASLRTRVEQLEARVDLRLTARDVALPVDGEDGGNGEAEAEAIEISPTPEVRELPGAREAGAAYAALRRQMEGDRGGPTAVAPREAVAEPRLGNGRVSAALDASELPDAAWLRGRRGLAADTYRVLRRWLPH